MQSVNDVQPENCHKLTTAGLLLYIIEINLIMFELCCHNLVQLAHGFGTKFHTCIYLSKEEIDTI